MTTQATTAPQAETTNPKISTFYLSQFEKEREKGALQIVAQEPLEIGFIGDRGDGKTINLARAGVLAMIQGLTVWSNFDIEFNWIDHKGELHHCKSLPLDLNSLLVLSSDFKGGLVLITEYQLYASSMSSNSTRNKLLSAIWAQIRKRSLSFYWDAKNLGWIQPWDRFETDYVVMCTNAVKTEWGKKHHVGKGEFIFADLYKFENFLDKSWLEKQGSFKLYAKPFWNCYKTNDIVDPFEAMANVDLDLEKRHISNKHQQTIDLDLVKRKTLEWLQSEDKLQTAWYWRELGISRREDKTLIRSYFPDWGIRHGGAGNGFVTLAD